MSQKDMLTMLPKLVTLNSPLVMYKLWSKNTLISVEVSRLLGKQREEGECIQKEYQLLSTVVIHFFLIFEDDMIKCGGLLICL